MPAPIATSISVALALLVAGCAKSDHRLTQSGRTPSASADHGQIVTLEVGGMTCQGCVARIEKELGSVAGVRRVDVSLADQRAHVLVDSTVADSALTGAVRRAGSEFLGIVLPR